ncbi:endonuclease/exonuclease/phosphatase family protein [Pedobacter aquae]|uniref:Endonuclease/exonuclease/phosphatase family protein n=1 Tax=Pedobacter aquae TaxID=2605747 RepID=A0A5C0VHD3_9SPHI|nr:endonuclease/exonuclease/phosphatase family protein [Pedobacter aquae]QEK51477.1 endonuclease/exonuclease/phosphatase family protein [Pedobacter aquae]
MKIITWNCNGAFRKKFDTLLDYDADLLIIQECENPLESLNYDYQNWAKNHLWIGDTKNKGLGVFAKPEITLKKLDWTNSFKNHTVKHFLPCKIDDEFDLLAVWTHKNNSPNFGYIGQIWKYLQVNKHRINKTIIAGDFNSNTKWDEWDRWWNHSDVVEELKHLGIESIYHKLTEEEQGKESNPTLYFQRKLSRPYHIDYIFAFKEIIERTTTFKIGEVSKWIKLSDHMPIFHEFI